MNKQENSDRGSKMIIWVVLVLLILILGGWYFMKGKSEGLTSQTSSESKTEVSNVGGVQAVDSSSGSGSLAELWKRGGNHMCTITMADALFKSSGTVYVSGNKVRADFNMTMAEMGNKPVTSSMIQKDGEVYTWTNSYPQGFKMKVPAGTNPTNMTGPNNAGGIDPSANVKYDCKSWTPDESKFTPPSDIKFMEAPTMKLN